MDNLQFSLQKGADNQVYLKPLFCNYTQLQAVCKSISQTPKSMRMIEMETGIPRPNICWYIKYLKSYKRITRIYAAICPYTRRRVGFYLMITETKAELTLFNDQ